MAKEMVEHSEPDGDEAEEGRMEQRRPRRARGGNAKINEYNAQGSPEAASAKDESEEFRKGGRARRKEGGMVHGELAAMRGDKAPRGRHAAGGRAGGSPFSSGRNLDRPSDDMAGRGKEGVKVPSDPQ